MANLAAFGELLTIPVTIGLVYFVWQLKKQAADAAAWKTEREKADESLEGEIRERHREVSARLDALKEWKDAHTNTCSTEHQAIEREIKELRNDLNKDVGQMKIDVARIAMAVQSLSWQPGMTPNAPTRANWHPGPPDPHQSAGQAAI